jgi:hypothetical protein
MRHLVPELHEGCAFNEAHHHQPLTNKTGNAAAMYTQHHVTNSHPGCGVPHRQQGCMDAAKQPQGSCRCAQLLLGRQPLCGSHDVARSRITAAAGISQQTHTLLRSLVVGDGSIYTACNSWRASKALCCHTQHTPAWY